MARAGFAYTPHETGDDLASCLYCNVSLSGWDDDDDPMYSISLLSMLHTDSFRHREEHRKRATKSDTSCPFFEHTESRQPKPPSTKPPSKSTSKPPSRTTSRTKYQDVSVPTKTFDGEVEDETDIRPNPKSTTHGLGAKTPAKPRSKSRTSSAKTPGAKSRSVSRSGFKNIAEEVEGDEQATEPPPTVKKTRSAKSVTKSEAPTESDVEQAIEPPPTVKKKKTRSGSKSVAKSEAPTPSDVNDEAEKPVEAPPTIKKKSTTRSKLKSVVRSEAVVQSEGEDDVTTTRRPTRSRAKSKAPVEVGKDEDEPIKKSSRSKSKVAADTEVDDDVPQRKTSRKGSKPKVVQEDLNTAEPVAHSAVGAKRKTTSHKRTVSRSRPKSPEAGSKMEEVVTGATPTKSTEIKSNPRSQSRPEIPNADDLFIDDIVPVEEYLPPPTSPPPSTTNSLPPLFIPKRTNDKPKLPSKVVEISSDEEEVQKRDPPIFEPKTQTLEPVETAGPSSFSTVNGVKDSEHHDLVKRQPIEDTMDVSMHDPGTQESLTDTEQELHTAPSTPPKPALHEEATGRSDAPQGVLQIPDDKSTDAQPSAPSTNTTLPLTTEPAYLPPLSRLPFMPLQTLNEAELDMTVEEWIRYQIEVEQDRFKRDGERELERFKKRAEEVRKSIEGL